MKTATLRQIEEHGRQLLAIFTQATIKDPLELCKRLRRLEAEAARFALRLCNGPEFETPEAADECGERILRKVDALLGYTALKVPVFLNRDPRGYQLKIDDEWLRTLPDVMKARFAGLHKDWGGYGIIAPEIK